MNSESHAWCIEGVVSLMAPAKFDKSDPRRFLDLAAEAEIDMVQVAIKDPNNLALYQSLGDHARKLDIQLSSLFVGASPAHIGHLEPKVRHEAFSLHKKHIECSAAIGATFGGGPFVQPLPYSKMSPVSPIMVGGDEWKLAVESTWGLAEIAKEYGIFLAAEFLNRFRVCYLWSPEEMGRFIREVNHPNAWAMLDLMHARMADGNVEWAVNEILPQTRFIHLSNMQRSQLYPEGNNYSEWILAQLLVMFSQIKTYAIKQGLILPVVLEQISASSSGGFSGEPVWREYVTSDDLLKCLKLHLKFTRFMNDCASGDFVCPREGVSIDYAFENIPQLRYFLDTARTGKWRD